MEDWDLLASHAFVHAAQSPSLLGRALYVPWFSAKRNTHVQYVLLRRKVLKGQ